MKGADYLVDGAYSIAKNLKISELAIGLTVVAFGTSMPELIVNIAASSKGASDIAIGNIFGSSIANVLLILGVSAIICPLPLKKQTVMSEVPFTIIATLLVGFLANGALFVGEKNLVLTRVDGIILLFFFVLYMMYIARSSKDHIIDEPGEMHRTVSISKSVFFVLIGITTLLIGGQWVVNGAIYFAKWLGISEALIGFTVVAIGTSLPELVTSIVAARKGDIDISVGNIIGSNIFNILFILGVSASIKPLVFSGVNNVDILIMLFSSVLIIVSMGTGIKNAIDRKNGIVFLLSYVVYIVFLVIRG
jgi:cation:H+ antiporter